MAQGNSAAREFGVLLLRSRTRATRDRRRFIRGRPGCAVFFAEYRCGISIAKDHAKVVVSLCQQPRFDRTAGAVCLNCRGPGVGFRGNVASCPEGGPAGEGNSASRPSWLLALAIRSRHDMRWTVPRSVRKSRFAGEWKPTQAVAARVQASRPKRGSTSE